MSHFKSLSLVVCCVAFSSVLSGDEPDAQFSIRSSDGSVLLGVEQIRSYDWETHTLTLTSKARKELANRLPRNQIVAGVPFSVKVGDDVIYHGKFTTVLSSYSIDAPIIVIDVQAIEPEVGADELRIQLGYPHEQFFTGKDPRGDERIRKALKESEKLGASKAARVEWVEKSMREMQAIKPGMTRDELMKVFVTEGGLSTRTSQRFVYRECPYFKVNVTFEAVDTPEENLEKAGADKIATISQPFLEWSIID